MANEQVGSIYEVGLDDVGYMLSDNPSRPVRRQIGILDTQPPGSDDPLSERIGRYDFIGQSDWTGGEGQEMADRPSSDATRYWRSEWLFPFTPGQLSCIDSSTRHIASTYVLVAVTDYSDVVVASGDVYLVTSATQLTSLDVPGGTETAFDHGGSGVAGFASDGEYWYVSSGLNVYRNNTAATPAAWSTEDVSEIAWCVDRLVGFDNVASPSELVTFSPTGTGTVQTMTHGTEFDLQGLCAGNGYVWYGANRIDGGHVRYWQMDSSPVNTGQALVLPFNEAVDNLFFYVGNVFLATVVTVGTNKIRKLYRCVPSDGELIPQLILETPTGALTLQRIWFTGNDRYVYFSWPLMLDSANEFGLGVIDLETGGYARNRAAGIDAAANIGGVVTWYGSSGFSVVSATAGDGGFWGVDDPVAARHAGYLETSISDLGTPALKHLDEIIVSSEPLASGESIAVAYSIDNGTTYTTLATFDTDGDTQHSASLTTAVTAASIQLKITLTPGSGTGPVVTGFVAKVHATGIVDEIIELPINCEDTIANVHGTTIAADSGPGKGMARLRALRALIGTKVDFQDVDYQDTGTTTLCEVVGVESTSVQVFNQNRNLNDVTSHVAVVTLRRPFSA